ncbi:MAG: carbon storage regulator [Phycisphaerae bacterium]|nr:carbon storage regulator [Phycisphaerae bacterium]MBM91133.1 carbon storage regulator [Phycisphaerae bacterium]HCT43973.1 carbon storage regulator [Phycisphaerales bacterium]|tara:strand:+ start:33 stop:383 length:351 start_codon:yes stop_codon:yes gene_type:complete
MLVLSRQRDETIMIGDEIEISIVDIRGDKVRLGINAPTRIAVHRKEVYDAIKRENAQAARLGANDIDSLAQTIKPGPARRVEREQGQSGTASMLGATRVSPGVGISSERDHDKDTA